MLFPSWGYNVLNAWQLFISIKVLLGGAFQIPDVHLSVSIFELHVRSGKSKSLLIALSLSFFTESGWLQLGGPPAKRPAACSKRCQRKQYHQSISINITATSMIKVTKVYTTTQLINNNNNNNNNNNSDTNNTHFLFQLIIHPPWHFPFQRYLKKHTLLSEFRAELRRLIPT